MSRRGAWPASGKRAAPHSPASGFAQIGFDYRLIGLNFVRRALCQLLAIVEHLDVVANGHYRLNVMLNVHDGGTVLANAPKKIEHGAGLAWVEAAADLIAQQEFRIDG